MPVVDVPRQRTIDEYVLLDAAQITLTNLGIEYLEPLFKSACGEEVGRDWENVFADEIGVDHWRRLGFDLPDNAEEAPGYWEASSRACALSAAMLATLARADVQQWMLEESARMAVLSSSHARKAEERGGDQVA